MTSAENGIFLVADEGGDVVGTVMAGYDGHRGWIYYLAVVPDRQGSGIGRALLESAERHLLSLGCPKINLQIRDDNPEALGFYEKLGYRLNPVTSLGKRLG